MLDNKPSIETKLTIIGLLVFFTLGILAFFLVESRLSSTPVILMYLVGMVVILIAVIGGFFYMNRTSEKAKRKLEELDTYSFIDALVDDLSRDEFNYLKRLVNKTYHNEEPLAYDEADDDLQTSPIHHAR
jgi:heme/copper-type cytochrome/quinol oxidase subunit 4